jgi:hypothetical protein
MAKGSRLPQLTRLTSPAEYKLYTWLKSNTVDLFRSEKAAPRKDDWWQRGQAVDEIRGWLRETPCG